MRPSSRSPLVAALVVGIAIGALSLSPVAAHVGDEISHLWSNHIKPLVKDDFYTKVESDGRFIKKRAVTKGFFSCPSTAWYPEEGDETYWMYGNRRYSTTNPLSTFHCNAVLPHGAKVTSVSFSLHDAVSPDFVACSLLRTHLENHAEVDMAIVNTDPPVGDSIQVDDSIESPTINNRRFTYSLQCVLFGTNEDIGFYGASVAYNVRATAGIAN